MKINQKYLVWPEMDHVGFITLREIPKTDELGDFLS